jgi:hypothetical protein
MAAVTSLAHPATTTKPKVREKGVTTTIFWSKALTSGVAASADTVDIAYLPAGARVVHASMRVDGSLGTGATIQLRHNASAVTGATTAGGADMEMMVSAPGAATSGTTVDVLVGTSAVTASANLEVRLGYVI